LKTVSEDQFDADRDTQKHFGPFQTHECITPKRLKITHSDRFMNKLIHLKLVLVTLNLATFSRNAGNAHPWIMRVFKTLQCKAEKVWRRKEGEGKDDAEVENKNEASQLSQTN
jgi:hypothetical protein